MKILSHLNKTMISLFVMGSLVVMMPSNAHAFPKGMLFPVVGGASFVDTYYGARANNTVHRATDIFAPKHTPIVSAVDGTVMSVSVPQPSYGYAVEIQDDEGFLYLYLHLNNDNPGTDDGAAGPMLAYAPDIPEGSRVKKGQLIGYLGDSGNAETTPPHLHFEILDSKGTYQYNYATSERVNPYPYLLEAAVPTGVNKEYPSVWKSEILPYGPHINAHVSIAMGKFDQSGKTSKVIATGKGYAPHVRVLDKNNNELAGFYAYNPNLFTGGVDVATGDVDGDGIDEIITGTLGGAPHVRVLKLDGTELGSFYAYSPQFIGGVKVSTLDINNDGKDEILLGAGPGGGPHVRVVSVDGQKEYLGFYAYAANYTAGVDVAGGDVTEDNAQEIVTSPGPGGSAHVMIYRANGTPVSGGFTAYNGFTGGVRVSVGNARVTSPASSDKQEILVGPWSNGGPHFRLLTAMGASVGEGYSYEPWWATSSDVAVGDGVTFVTTGVNRRSSISAGPN